MAGTKNATGWVRSALLILTFLLIAGVSASIGMSVRARNAAIATTVSQVQTITDRSLTLVIHPSDLTAPVVGDRRNMLSDQITASVLDTSPITSVTLWSPDGRILYSTDTGRIGNQLPGERDRLKAAIAGTPQTQDIGGQFSVTVPFQLPSGAGTPAAIEMTKPDAPIASAAAPWRTNAVFLAILLVVVTILLVKVRKISEMLSGYLAFSKPKAPVPTAPLLPILRPRATEVQSLGLRGEADARRRAEERAIAAEERASTLQEKYRKTLEDLQAAQHDLRVSPENSHVVPQLEDRALKAEGRVNQLEAQLEALQAERERISQELLDSMSGVAPGTDVEELNRLRQVEHDSIGLRAELDGAQTQLSLVERELESIRSSSGNAGELQEELDAAHLQSLHSREQAEQAQVELSSAQEELESARNELRTLRNEHQRAAMLEDELRAAKAELENASSGGPVEERDAKREAEFEAQVRTIREEFQDQIASMEASYKDQLGQRDVELADRLVAAEQQAKTATDELESIKAELKAAKADSATAKDSLVRQAEQHAATAAEFEAMKAGLTERQERFDRAGDQVKRAEGAAASLVKTLDKTKSELAVAREQAVAQKARADELSTELARADAEAREATQRAADLAAQLDGAAQSNTDLNRRMQEVEARRALELAGTEGRADLDEILRVTQERLAGQTEKLIRAEERVHELERDMTTVKQRNEEVEARLRQRQMSGAIKQMRGEGEAIENHVVDVDGESAIAEKRAASPFVLELSLDARKALTRILGVTQVLKHKKDAKDQAQLLKQLAAYARRLDHTVSDLVDAEQLAMGTVELNVKRTDLKALAARVVEESGVGSDHNIQLETESLIVGVDQRRTEAILAGLLRVSGDRTPVGKGIAVKLSHVDGGALLFVEDPEPAKTATVSQVVQRFAEVQGGWARVEALEDGGTSFRVFLPDGGPDQASKGSMDDSVDKLERELQMVVDEEPWDPAAEKILVDELHRLSELAED